MKQRTWMTMVAAALVALLAETAHAVIIELVPVGNPGNANDPETGYGSVAQPYLIGKYEVSNAQWREFLTAKASVSDPNELYNSDMSGTYGGIDRTWSVDHYVYTAKGGDAAWDNRKVNYVSFWDAARFTNWLGNGQGTGSTETGAYTLDDYNGSAGGNISRNPGARWFIPTIDEWYKAAYYAGGTNGGYYDQPTASAYGTVDQYGNGWEWSESVVSVGSVDSRILGGGYGPLAFPVDFKGSSLGDPSHGHGPIGPPENIGFGFRVASVPEPGSLVMLAGIALTALLYLPYWWREWA